ncbi:DMT family transporter [Sulfobacillus thermosulfidooxidans]|uniref:DMT family transporter n=1 Tax=Sulfobacillus thermosulfidooxidans TaxID=28034 RepID=UPI0002F5493F|nr:DMT family transporter [Sulfobacillus thermosulfidooxidans]
MLTGALRWWWQPSSWLSTTKGRVLERPWIGALVYEGGLLLVAMIWGTSYLATKTIVAVLPVFWFLALRFSLTALILLVLSYKSLRHTSWQLWRSGMILGLFISGIYVLETIGISQTSAVDAGLLIALNVILTPFVDAMIRTHRLHWRVVGILAVGLLGTVLITGSQSLSLTLGSLWILGASGLRAVQVSFSKKLVGGHDWDPKILSFIEFSVVAVVTFLIAKLYYPLSWVQLLQIPSSVDELILYLVLLGTVFAFLMQWQAIKRSSPAKVALLLGTEPLWALLVGIIWGHEHLSFAGYLGAALLIGATLWGRREG